MQPRKLEGFTYTQPAVNPNAVFAQILQQKEQERLAQEAQKAKGKRGSGNQSWLSSLISELGGAGGATGGAAIGAGIGAGFGGVGALPGAIIGGLLGGFGGGTAGRLVENQVRDNEMRLGDALKEGALSGAFGAGGAAFQGLRGAQALGKASQGGLRTGVKALGGLSDDAAKAVVLGGKKAGAAVGSGFADDLATAAKKTAGKNVLERTGNRQYRNVLGIDDIKSPLKSGPKTLFKADDMLEEARRLQLSGTPKSMLRQVNTQYQRFNDLVGRELAKSKGTTSLKELTKSIQDDVARRLPIKQAGASVQDELVRSLDDLSRLAKNGKLSAKDLHKFKNNLNVDSAFRKLQGDLASDLTAKEAVDMALWRQADDWITKLAPGAKELTKRQSNLYGLSQGLSKMTLTPGDPKSVMEFATRIASPGVRNVQGAFGRTTANLGAATPSVPGGALARQIGRGTAVRGVANNALGLGGQPVEQPEATNETANDTITSADIYQLLSSPSASLGGTQTGGTVSNNPFSAENAQTQIAQILARGGDFKDVKDYLSIVSAMSELSGGGNSLTAGQTNKAIQLASVGQELRTLASEVEGSGLFKDQSQIEASIGGFIDSTVGRLTDTQKKIYIDQLKTRGIQVVRALGEVGNLSEAEQEAAIKNLPSPGDTLEGARQKIRQLIDRFQDIENIVYAGGGGPEATFGEALNNYGGGL